MFYIFVFLIIGKLMFQGMNYALRVKDKKHGTLFLSVVRRIKVFARVTPKQKEIVITTLKSQGNICLVSYHVI